MTTLSNIFHYSFKRFGKRTVLAISCSTPNCTYHQFPQPFTSKSYQPELYNSIKHLCSKLSLRQIPSLNEVLKTLHKHLIYKPKSLVRYEQELENVFRNILLDDIDNIFEVFQRLILTDNSNFRSSLLVIIKCINCSTRSLELNKYLDYENLLNLKTISDALNKLSIIVDRDSFSLDVLTDTLKDLNIFIKNCLLDCSDSLSIDFTIYLLNHWDQINIDQILNTKSKIQSALKVWLNEHPFIIALIANNDDHQLHESCNFEKFDCLIMPTKEFLLEEYETVNQLVNDRSDLLKRKLLKRKKICTDLHFGKLISYYFFDATKFIKPYCNVEKTSIDKVKLVLAHPQLIYSENSYLNQSDSEISSSLEAAWSNASKCVNKLSNTDIEKLWRVT